MSNRRTGKIARLPDAVREQVNQMLQDGVPYRTIIQKLDELGHPHFNLQNLQNWKAGGHQDWLAARRRQAFLLEQTKDILARSGKADAITYSATALGMYQLFHVLNDFDPALLQQRLAQRPERYFDIFLAYNRLLKTRFAVEEKVKTDIAREAEAKWCANLEQEIRADMGGISSKPPSPADKEEDAKTHGQPGNGELEEGSAGQEGNDQ